MPPGNNTMIKVFKILFTVAVSLASVLELSAQSGKYTVQNGHAHNDYLNTVPFYHAFSEGFGSIEADVFPVNDELFVAHGKSEIQPNRTLKKLYLDALKKELKRNPARQLNLLIDIKENHQQALKIIIVQLKPLQKYLATKQKQGKLTVIISGNRPVPGKYADYPDCIFFDSDLSLPHTPEQWQRVGLVSLQFSKLSKWNETKKMSSHDESVLQQKIDSVHQSGKKIRFWAAPDNPVGWEELLKLGADYIGTDHITELAAFLKRDNGDQSALK